MKVLHFYRTYYPDTFGGIEQAIFQLAEGGLKHGVQAEVLSLSRKGSARERIVGHHTTHCSKLNIELASNGFSLSAFKDFSELASRADVVHYHFPWPFMDLVHFITHLKKPTVVSYHSDIVRQKFLLQLYRPLMNCFLGSVDRIVAASPKYLETSPILRRWKDKTVVIPYGLDKNSYAPPQSDLLEQWRSRVGDRFFLFVGQLRYYKGLHILLDALQGTQFPVVIAGSGPVESEIKQQAQLLGLQNIHFLGKVSDEDKSVLLKLCYAAVLPSHLRSEAFGIFLLEGAMFGKPMISCEIGTGTSYTNIDFETGRVVPPNDATALREAMGFLWDNPTDAAEMGERAGERYRKLFTADRMTSSYIHLYNELLAEPVRSPHDQIE